MDISKLMQMAETLQQQLGRSQEDAARVRVNGEAGGGMVRVTLNGRYEVIEVVIDPKLINPQDRALLEDMVRAAFNQASARVLEELQRKVSSFAASLGLDPAVLSSLLPKP